jgi:hypothetical protein
LGLLVRLPRSDARGRAHDGDGATDHASSRRGMAIGMILPAFVVLLP